MTRQLSLNDGPFLPSCGERSRIGDRQSVDVESVRPVERGVFADGIERFDAV